jgi:hypothetical protein
MNIGTDNNDEDNDAECDSSSFISDLTVISNRTSKPPILCLAQYFGEENDLCGGLREIKPWIIFMFDFTFTYFHVFDHHPSDHIESSNAIKILDEFEDKSSNNDLFNEIMNYIMHIEH